MKYKVEIEIFDTVKRCPSNHDSMYMIFIPNGETFCPICLGLQHLEWLKEKLIKRD